jgi:hypothetical protein
MKTGWVQKFLSQGTAYAVWVQKYSFHNYRYRYTEEQTKTQWFSGGELKGESFSSDIKLETENSSLIKI